MATLQKSMADTGSSLLQESYALSGSTPSDKLLRQIISREYQDASGKRCDVHHSSPSKKGGPKRPPFYLRWESYTALNTGGRWRCRYFSGATAGHAASLDRAGLAHTDQVRALLDQTLALLNRARRGRS
jgi:hypothetical protein